MLAVIDTSVFIAGLISKSGTPRQVINALNNGIFVPVISKSTIEELSKVVTRKKFRHIINANEATMLIEKLYRNAVIVDPKISLRGVTADLKDDPFIEAALSARAKYVVSLDQHLLNVCSYRGILVIRPKKFLEKILLK